MSLITKFLSTLLHRREAGIAVMIVLLALVVGAIQPRFLTLETLRIIALAIPLILIAAMGQMMVLVARHVDLSIGSILAFSSIIAGIMFRDLPDVPIIISIVAAIACGGALGFANGVIVTLFRLPSIIVTLGTLSLYRGLVFLVSGARQVDPQYIPRSLIEMSQTSPIFGIPWIVILAFVIALLTYFFLDHVRLGRQIYALGSNPVAAPLRGIKVVPLTILVFTMSGALAGLTGIIYASRFGYVNPGITGVGFEFTVIAAVVIGGVSINGGVGTVLGTVLGVILLGMVNVALPLLGVSAFWQDVIYGAVIVIALLIDKSVRDRSARALAAARSAA
ncbi:ABC transporter permease [Devosia rhodophyticola]|uniref:Autoinducer 2 import system permease protein LsrC n=1 Tax=Devosia rhodophyticola TaxID=3026423 RepID=A0ABY7Z046_9HYPH|nr:ABC transporter permease [Devosia rhodophyticola]WDR06703.1 ABC transporter permease [Devosia rhodophyticola]